MNNYKKQQGASTPLVLLFIAMAMIVLTIAFKLYPAFYEHWQVKQVLEGFDEETGLADLTVKEIKRNFEKRLLTNNVRDFNSNEGLTVVKQDGTLSIYVEYEVRIPIYENIDALVSFEESLEKQL
tara:strand:- start:79966 stop:80340 length:375 start_codon:yes stop_codon:yes gene_type:complete